MFSSKKPIITYPPQAPIYLQRVWYVPLQATRRRSQHSKHAPAMSRGVCLSAAAPLCPPDLGSPADSGHGWKREAASSLPWVPPVTTSQEGPAAQNTPSFMSEEWSQGLAMPRDLHVVGPENGAACAAAFIPVFNFCLIRQAKCPT